MVLCLSLQHPFDGFLSPFFFSDIFFYFIHYREAQLFFDGVFCVTLDEQIYHLNTLKFFVSLSLPLSLSIYKQLAPIFYIFLFSLLIFLLQFLETYTAQIFFFLISKLRFQIRGFLSFSPYLCCGFTFFPGHVQKSKVHVLTKLQ